MNARPIYRGIWGLLVIFSLSVSLPAQMGAAQPQLDGTTITVNSFGDDLTVNGNCTLREAITAANTDLAVDACPAGNGADTILLPAGTLTITLADSDEYGAPEDDANAVGDFDITSSIYIVGAGKAATTLDGEAGSRAFDVFPGALLSLRNFTLFGTTFYSTDSDENGVLQNYGTLLIEQVRIEGCSTSNVAVSSNAPAGAISSTGALSIRHAEFIDNSTDYDGDGAAINSEGSLLIEDALFENHHTYEGTITAGGPITIRRTTFRDNTASSDDDAISIGGTVLIEDSLFEDIESSYGEGSPGINFAGEVTIRRTQFVSNSFVQVHGTVLMENVLFDATELDDRASSLTLRGSTLGGAGASVVDAPGVIDPDYWVSMLRVNEGIATLETSTLTANLGALEVAGGELTIRNSTLSGNELTQDWYLQGQTGWDSLIMVTGGSLTIESSTITNNHGDYALHVTSGSASLRNTILNATHWPGEPNHTDCLKDSGASLTSLGYNIVSIASGCGWPSVTGDQLGTTSCPLNPGLFALADNGGPTLTHALREGSIALDTGHPSLFPPTDQRGEARPADGDGNGVARADIGAFEAAAPPPKLDDILYLPLLGR